MKIKGLETGLEHAQEKKIYFERILEINKFLETISWELRLKNVPVDNFCRINVDDYQNLDKEKDNDKVNQLKKKFYENLTEKEIAEKKLQTDGEQLEILTTIALYKKLSPRFIVVRASEYDDFINGVDHIIIDTETNTPVCAFDEISTMEGLEFQKKQKNVSDRNTKKSGAKIKYGLHVDNEKNITKKNMENIPILYLSFPVERLRSGMKNIQLSLKDSLKFENDFFIYFKSIVEFQINQMNWQGTNPKKIKEKLEQFKNAIKDIN